MPLSERDRGNLYFLLYSDPKVIRQWVDQASPEEIDYVNRLLREHRDELMDRFEDNIQDQDNERYMQGMDKRFPDAARVIARIKKNLDNTPLK
jgi:predicted transcriptional regulator